MVSGGNIIPTIRYRDAAAMIEWLCNAFGFERHLVVEGEGNTIEHAQLVLGSGMIMLGSAREDDFDSLQKPASRDAPVTQSPYIVVDDADAHHDRALAHGAEITAPLSSPDYGGRLYSVRDPEGQLWNFGTYDPWTTA